MNHEEGRRVSLVLTAAGVDHAAIGGLAVSLHAAVLGRTRLRPVHDLDVLVRPWDAGRAIDVAASLGYEYLGPVQVHDPGTRRARMCRKALMDLGHGRHAMIDLLSDWGALGIGVLDDRVTIAGVRVAGLRRLRELKEIAGRPHDLEDLALLEDPG